MVCWRCSFWVLEEGFGGWVDGISCVEGGKEGLGWKIRVKRGRWGVGGIGGK